MTTDPADLLGRFQAMAARLPHPPRARDAAEAFGVSEGALTEARRLSGEAVTLAMPDGPEGLLRALPGVGALMALARNADCVLEIEGVIGEAAIAGQQAVVAGLPRLEIDFAHWHAAYTLTEDTRSGRLSSIQLFDRHGDAVLKLYPAETGVAAFAALVDRLSAPDATPARFAPAPQTEATPLPAGEALPLPCLQPLLEAAAAAAVPMAIAIANRGCRETFAGRVETIKPTGAWLNVLDPAFNMHLRADRVAHLRLTPDRAVIACRADGAEIVRFDGGAGWDAALAQVQAQSLA